MRGDTFVYFTSCFKALSELGKSGPLEIPLAWGMAVVQTVEPADATVRLGSCTMPGFWGPVGLVVIPVKDERATVERGLDVCKDIRASSASTKFVPGAPSRPDAWASLSAGKKNGVGVSSRADPNCCERFQYLPFSTRQSTAKFWDGRQADLSRFRRLMT